MERLTRGDYETLLAFLRDLDTIDETRPFADQLLPMMLGLVPFDLITYNQVDLRRGRNPSVAYPAGNLPDDAEARFEPLIDQHPIIRHVEQTRDSHARKLSDFISQRQFRQLGLYRDFFRLAGVDHQIALTLPAPSPIVLGIALNRHGVDFSERERLLLDLSRPHLVAAHRRSTTSLRLHQRLAALQQAAPAGTDDARDQAHAGFSAAGRESQREPAPLTERENEVLSLLSQGKTDRQIAALLAVSHRTIQKHVEHLLAKLDVPNRTTAAVRALGPSIPEPQD